MKRIGAVGIALACVILIGLAATAEEKPWFDLEKCIFCKNLLADGQDLTKHMTWENHMISNGAVQVYTVEPEYHDAYIKANEAMEKIGMEMAQGKHMDAYMCGSCQAYGTLMMKGVKFDMVHAKGADIMVISSDNPEVVKEIQAYTQKNIDELAKMMEAAE